LAAATTPLLSNSSKPSLTTVPRHDSGNNDFTFPADITKHLWETVAAPRHLDWALSMLDLLIYTGTQLHANLAPILVAITESVAFPQSKSFTVAITFAESQPESVAITKSVT